MDLANYTCVIRRHYFFSATFAQLFFRIFEQNATLDNVWKWEKMTGSLVEKRDLVFQIFMDFMDFKMDGIVADTSLS